MKRARRQALSKVGLVSAWLVLVAGAACSRTDDPIERYASAKPSGGAAGTPASSAAGKSHGGAENAAGSAPRAGTASAGTAGANLVGEGGAAGASATLPEDPCGEAPVSSEPFTKRALRAAAADCALWHYCRFETAATALDSALADHAAVPDAETLGQAREAFARAMQLWSVVEQFQFGPLASSAEAAGKDLQQGKGIRELIYAWPLTVRYRVEEQVVNRNYETSFASDTVLVSARGLFALDYLLSYEGTDTQCSPNSLCGKNWLKYDADELRALKRDYAVAVAQDIVQHVSELRAAWSPDGGNFRPLFVDATGYEDENQVMTALAWALLYAEREVKDYKLGVPAGYTLTSPVTLPEAPYAGLATQNVRANLRGFRALFQGCGPDGEGLGVDDWLNEAGHPELAADIVTAWRTAQATADAFPIFSSATPSEIEGLYRAVKALTDLLKSDLFGSGSPLGLELPKGIEGDTD